MHTPHFPVDVDPFRHSALTVMLTDRILSLARDGWTPEDFRHITGPRINRYLRTALKQATAAAPERVAAAWLRQCRPPTRRDRQDAPLAEMQALLGVLNGLPPLQGAEDLTDLSSLRAAAGEDAATPEQRKARERISGLLAKAESTTFAHEAESLVAKAQQLRQRYRIDTLDPLAADVPGNVVALRIHLTAPWVRFQHLLLGSIAAANSCRAVLVTPVDIATLVGHPDDVLHTAELFASLNRQRDYFMRTSPGAATAAARGETSAYRRSFLQSYAHRIGDLLTEATASTETSPQERTSVLPVLARRSEVTEHAFSEMFPGTTPMSLGHRFHAPGATDGIRAAERSHLGPERTAVGQA
ncbi:DUF2786 domain-containing protein [Corynebacterium sp.]|uniref:DUF2786 domain-containing protein n=1 Tax=Corynebacterium sp. TaxID=1720 RepID=UPI0026DF5EEE|nr:DUF2786 domain-containing protein [Corynebacterium sp.]MDO5511413.1 DUF2786 domain-containing protein [Corynebacterium sp.]